MAPFNTSEAMTVMAPDSAIFGSAGRCLRSDGIYRRISVPAAGNLVPVVQEALAGAKADGIARPIVLGALPFCPEEPSALFIPKSYTWVDAPTALPSDGAMPNGSLALVSASSTAQAAFENGVSKALASFASSDLMKVVLARTLDLEFSQPIVVEDILARLVTAHPRGYPFAIPLSSAERLVGLSPELLIAKYGGQLSSHPLAGSLAQRLCPERDEAETRLMNSSKDRHEHQIVVDAVRAALQPFCVRLNVPSEPSIVRAAQLWHLGSLISGTLEDATVSVLTLLKSLHPTPAVLGFPPAEARAAIAALESFSRGMFAGAVGWMDEDGDGEWAVSIRCGLISNTRGRLYAGAGIVAGSDPAQEWAETATKMRPMLRALGWDGEAQP